MPARAGQPVPAVLRRISTSRKKPSSGYWHGAPLHASLSTDADQGINSILVDAAPALSALPAEEFMIDLNDAIWHLTNSGRKFAASWR